MKRILLLALTLFTIHCSLFTLDATAQSRTNRIYRNCPGTTTKAAVAIDVAGNITVTPCSGKTTTITGDATNPAILTSYLTTTVTYNNTAALANTALSVTVATGGIYDIEITVHSVSGAGTSLKMDFGGTATSTNFIGQWRGIGTADSAQYADLRSVAPGDDFESGITLANNEAYFTFKGTIEVNAGGTFLFRGAQAAATAVDTSILRGSTLKLTKLN